MSFLINWSKFGLGLARQSFCLWCLIGVCVFWGEQRFNSRDFRLGFLFGIFPRIQARLDELGAAWLSGRVPARGLFQLKPFCDPTECCVLGWGGAGSSWRWKFRLPQIREFYLKPLCVCFQHGLEPDVLNTMKQSLAFVSRGVRQTDRQTGQEL